jgi:hypothetical protein
MQIFCEINSGQYTEAVLSGAIGTAKTTLALWTTAYQLYKLLLYRNPHAEFDLDRSSEIVFIFQSISGQHAKGLDYDRFRHLLLKSPFFNETNYSFDHSLISELRFPRRIIVKPVSGAQTAAIGQNVFGGLLDEVNYMAVVEKSRNAIDQGVYDQAVELYNSISRRRKSRFMRQGVVPGIFCIVSSKRYPGQFTDRKEAEAKRELAETGKTSIYLFDKRTWEILPEDRFSGNWFHVFIGDATRRARIIDDTEKESFPTEAVMPVPVEYRKEFEEDIINALREIGGVSTLARFPFMLNTDAVAAGFGKHESILSQNEVDFKVSTVSIRRALFRQPEQPRFAHVDLGLTGDSAGVVIGCVERFIRIRRTEKDEEILPVIRIDCTLRVRPPKNDEIQFHKIRTLFYKLRETGLNLKWVSFDSYQSVDSLQVLRQRGFVCGTVSMDTSPLPYEILKSAFNDQRVFLPRDTHLLKELLSLERDQKTGKIDHGVHGSKDVADALAGVVYGLTMRREIWASHNISVFEIPQYLREQSVKLDSKLRSAGQDLETVSVDVA